MDSAPKGPGKSAQGAGDASYASVAIALGRRGISVSIAVDGIKPDSVESDRAERATTPLMLLLQGYGRRRLP
jgi:hypothetical protein